MTLFLIYGRIHDARGPLMPFMADTGEVINSAGATGSAPLVVEAWDARDAVKRVRALYPNGLPEYMATLKAREIYTVTA